MQDGSDDPASIAIMIDVGPVGTRTEDFLHKRLVTVERAKGIQKAGKAEGCDLRCTEFEALSGPDMTLSARTGL